MDKRLIELLKPTSSFFNYKRWTKKQLLDFIDFIGHERPSLLRKWLIDYVDYKKGD